MTVRPAARPRHVAAPIIIDYLLAEALTVEEIGERLRDLKPVGTVVLAGRLYPHDLEHAAQVML